MNEYIAVSDFFQTVCDRVLSCFSAGRKTDARIGRDELFHGIDLVLCADNHDFPAVRII